MFIGVLRRRVIYNIAIAHRGGYSAQGIVVGKEILLIYRSLHDESEVAIIIQPGVVPAAHHERADLVEDTAENVEAEEHKDDHLRNLIAYAEIPVEKNYLPNLPIGL